MLSSAKVLPAAESTGFNPGTHDKVLHLINLLNARDAHPFLKGKGCASDHIPAIYPDDWLLYAVD